MNPYAILAIAGGAAVLCFAIWVKSTQTAAYKQGRAEAEAETAKDEKEEQEQLDERIQAADETVAAQRDPALGTERLHSGTA